MRFSASPTPSLLQLSSASSPSSVAAITSVICITAPSKPFSRKTTNPQGNYPTAEKCRLQLVTPQQSVFGFLQSPHPPHIPFHYPHRIDLRPFAQQRYHYLDSHSGLAQTLTFTNNVPLIHCLQQDPPSPSPPVTASYPLLYAFPPRCPPVSLAYAPTTTAPPIHMTEHQNYEHMFSGRSIIRPQFPTQYYPTTEENETLPKETSPQRSLVEGVSNFLQTSFTDVPLGELEEVLGRLSINDSYHGPLRSVQEVNENYGGKNSNQEDPYLLLPYSNSSLAFVPPGMMVVTEVWEFFARERLSLCNVQVNNMKTEQVQKCLHAHGLNQLGTPHIVRRRLSEFVRRLRESNVCRNSNTAAAIASYPTPDQPDDSDEFSHVTFSETSFPQLKGSLVKKGKNEDADYFRMIKLSQPVVLTPDTFYHYLLIIDLEATCDGKPQQIGYPEFHHEIIEFPVLLYDTHQRKCVSVFHSYCRPKLNPNLSTFCTSLTKISQDQVDAAVTFPTLLIQLENWLLSQNELSGKQCAIVCDCSADMAKFMRMQCQLSRIQMPSWARVWINLSKAFRLFYRLPPRHRSTLSAMLEDLELSFVGQQHRGLDDATNILRVVQILLADGCRLRVNERMDAGRPPHFTSSVPRQVAESACGLMGSKLGLLAKRSKSASYYTQPGGGPQAASEEEVNETDRDRLLWLHSIQKQRVGRSNV